MRMYNKLIWEDDFDGSELDMTKWSFRTGKMCIRDRLSSLSPEPSP